MTKLSIAVIGAGFAGSSFSLFAKKFLSKKYKLDITMFERVQNPSPVGAGILIQPIGLYCLNKYNPELSKHIKNHGKKVNNLNAVTKSGKTVMDLYYSKLHPDIYGIGTQRGTLFTELHNYLHEEKIPLLCGMNMVSVETRNNQNYLKDSQSHEYGPFDLVVVADGKNSTLRNHLQGEFPVKNHHYKWGALWSLVPDHPERPCKNSLYQVLNKCHQMIGYLPSGTSQSDPKSKLSFFWSIHERDLARWKSDEITLEEWKKSVKELDPYMSQYILDYIKSKDQLSFADYSDIRMENVGKRNIIFIGDAAHATSPVLGQGTNLALYDGYSLSQHLLEYDNLNESLKRFSQERKDHVLFYLRASKILNPVFQSDHIPGLSMLRDNITPIMLKIPFFYNQGLKTQSGFKNGCKRNLLIFLSIDGLSC